MGVQRTTFATFDEERKHRQNVIAKLQRVQGLEALLAEWEGKSPDGDFSDRDYAYILKLRARLRSARTQYESMKP